MRYSEIFGGIIGGISSITLTLPGILILDIPRENISAIIGIGGIVLIGSSIGAYIGKRMVHQFSLFVKKTYDNRALALQKSDPYISYSYLNPMQAVNIFKKNITAEFLRHTGAAMRNTIDRIDRGDIPKGLSGRITALSTKKVISVLHGIEVDIILKSSIEEALSQNYSIPHFVGKRITSYLQIFIEKKVLPIAVHELSLPKFLK